MGLSSAADVECQSIMRFLKQEEMETLVATSEENSATIQSISKTIAAQNNSVKDILRKLMKLPEFQQSWKNTLTWTGTV